MGKPFLFPDVGEGIGEGKLVHWHVKKGSMIKKDAPLADIETDKAIVQIPSPQDGTIEELLHNEGDMIIVGQPLLTFAGERNDHENTKPAHEKNTDSNNNTLEETSVSTTNNAIDNNMAQPIDTGRDKTTNNFKDNLLAMPAVRHAAKQQGIDLSTIQGTGNHGQIIMSDLSSSAPVNNKTQINNKNPDASAFISKNTHNTAQTISTKKPVAAPHIRQLARTLGININQVTGSGQHGRITEEDLKKFNPKDPLQSSQQNTTASSAALAKDAFSQSTTTEHSYQFSEVRKITAQRMLASLQQTAQLTIFEELNANDLVHIKKELQSSQTQTNPSEHITYLPFIIKAAAIALEEYPLFKAYLNEQKNGLVPQDNATINIAVDTKHGLFVPAITHARTKSIHETAQEMNELVIKAQHKQLSPNDMHQGIFTITSVGNLGGTYFTPVLNSPQVGILGVGRISKKPWVNTDEESKEEPIIIAHVLPLSLTFDHQAMDGAYATKFLMRIKQLLSSPNQLLYEA